MVLLRFGKHFWAAHGLCKAEAVAILRKKGVPLEDITVLPNPDEGPQFCICELCGKRFKNAASITEHMMKHTGECPFSCTKCLESFPSARTLELHLKTHTLHPCTICNKRFKTPSGLRLHMDGHFDIRPYSCHICKKKFLRRVVLLGHVRSHTGEKPYVCPRCGKCFSINGNMKAHLKIHDSNRDTKKKASPSVQVEI